MDKQQESAQSASASAAVAAGNSTDEQVLENVRTAVHAAEEKKAQQIVVLRLAEITSFTDYFVICSGASTRQVQTIADAVVEQVKGRGVRPMQTEGYTNAEWILIDFGTFVVHVFTEASRRFYDLERLWRDATKVEI